MKCTCFYNNGKGFVKEVATMKEPTEDDVVYVSPYLYDYYQHLEDLPEYPAEWVTKEMEGKEVECEIKYKGPLGFISAIDYKFLSPFHQSECTPIAIPSPAPVEELKTLSYEDIDEMFLKPADAKKNAPVEEEKDFYCANGKDSKLCATQCDLCKEVDRKWKESQSEAKGEEDLKEKLENLFSSISTKSGTRMLSLDYCEDLSEEVLKIVATSPSLHADPEERQQGDAVGWRSELTKISNEIYNDLQEGDISSTIKGHLNNMDILIQKYSPKQ
jgi:hypothetical protein